MSGLKTLIDGLQKIDLSQPEENIIAMVKPLVANAIAKHETWFEDRFLEIDEAQGFGSHLIAENEDHTLAVIISSWPEGRETPPHDHDTWAVIGCIRGIEKNTVWHRHDDGSNPDYAHITPDAIHYCKPGDIVAMTSKDIHSVMNPETGISVSLHIYGKHFNHTNRYQYDPHTFAAKPFIVRQKSVIEVA